MASNNTNLATDNNVNGVEHGEKTSSEKKERPAPVVFLGSKSTMDKVLEDRKSKSEKKVLFPGDITIKAQLDDDIRCISYNNQELTFVDLLKLLERMFKKAVKATDDLVLKYRDAEGDYVTMEDSDDVGFAIRTCGGLNIKILRPKSEEEAKVKSSEIRVELLEIRDKVNSLLDHLEGRDVELDKPSAPTLSSLNFKESPTDQQGQVPVSVPSTSEFDPLKGVSSSSDEKQADSGLTTVSHGAPSQPQPTPPNQATVRPEKNANYQQMTNQNQATPSQYQAAGAPATTNQAPVQAYQHQPQQPPQQQQQGAAPSSMYGQAPAPSYSNANQYQSPPTSYGATPSSYVPSPNAPSVSSTTWGDSNANSQTRGYQQPGMTPAGQQTYVSSPLPTSSASAYGSAQPQPTYGMVNAPPQIGGNPGSSALGRSPMASPQIGGGQAPPSQMGVAQGPPQMGGVQTPTLISGSQAPPSQMAVASGPLQMGVPTLISGGQGHPQIGGIVAPPQMGGGQAPPQMGGGQAPPQMGGGQAPQMGGVQAPPQMTGPPPMNTYRPGGPPQGASNPYSRTAANRFGQ